MQFYKPKLLMVASGFFTPCQYLSILSNPLMKQTGSRPQNEDFLHIMSPNIHCMKGHVG